MECIHCTQCIDACDAVMDRVGLRRGLVRYTSQAELAGDRRSFLRPRVVVYSAILAVMFGALGFALAGKQTADVTLLRGLGAPFTVLPDGRVSNQIRIKIANRSEEERSYLIELAGGGGLELIAPENPLTVAPGETEMTAAFITAPPSAFSDGEAPIALTIGDGVDFKKTLDHRILGPAARGNSGEGSGP
jgi:polyferredoxin